MKKTTQTREAEEQSIDQNFTGVARSVECFNNQGFKNFRIVTLYLKNGRIERQEYSDPYASFEVISRMEMQNEIAIHNLNNTWATGKTLCK